jgi:hypothetical protein
MKKNIFFTVFLIIIGTVIIFTCCKKESTNSPIERPRSLQIILFDTLHNPIPNASVKLYSSIDDLFKGTNQIGSTLTTNSNGAVIFSNLSDKVVYYWFAQNGGECINNLSDVTNTDVKIIENTTSSFTSLVTSNGALKFVNTSTDTIACYIKSTIKDSTLIFTFKGINNDSIFKPIGSYNIVIKQISKIVANPAFITSTEKVTCGNTTTILYP